MPRFTSAAILIGVLLAPVLLPASEPQPEGAESVMPDQQRNSIQGTIWRLESFKSEGLDRQPISSRDATLRLEGGRISGSGGCNGFRGGYTLNRDWLAFGPLAGTRKACSEPGGAMEQEAAILKALQSVANYRIEGGELTLTDGDGKPAAKFRATE